MAYVSTTNRGGAVVRSFTFGVRANAIYWFVIACCSDTPAKLTGSRIRLKG